MTVVTAAYHVIGVVTTGYAANGRDFVSYVVIDGAPMMMLAIDVMKHAFVYATDYPI